MVIDNAANRSNANDSLTQSKAQIWAGRIFWILSTPFMAFDVAIHLANPAPVVEASKKLGLAPGAIVPIGVVEFIALAVYLLPRTAPLGAVLLTAYLGGAVATNVIAGMPFWFAVTMGAFLWISLYCRDARVRNLIR